MKDTIQFTQVSNDINGNPRYVVHFLDLLTPQELEGSGTLTELYDVAVARARQIGGRRFHNKQYRGGIAFVSYDLNELRANIAHVVGGAASQQAGAPW